MLAQLFNRSIEYLSINVTRLGILTGAAIGLILASSEAPSDTLAQFIFTQLTGLDHILQATSSSPPPSLLFSPGVKVCFYCLHSI